ncbi:MAG: hypothetical protein AAFQ87_06170 [Bacteroidota bacterium]
MPYLSVQAQEEEAPISQNLNVGLQWSNRGPGLSIIYNLGDPTYRQWTFGLDAFAVKDLRETTIEPLVADQGRPYIYGKLNHLLVISPMVGIEWPLFGVSALSPLSVKGGFRVGPALGFLNPYQIETLTLIPGSANQYSVEVEAFNPTIHAHGDILGRANFLSSRLQPQIQPGLSAKAYTIIDFTRSQYGIGGLIISAHTDVFLQSVPILAEINGRTNRQTFFAVSLGLLFGRAW